MQHLREELDPFMAWLGVCFGLIALIQLAPLTSDETRTLELITSVMWLAFVAEYIVHVALASDRRRYVRTHWLTALMLLPTLRIVSLLRLARFGRAFPAARVIGSCFRSSRLGYLFGAGTVLVTMCAELLFVAFRHDGSGAFATFTDTLLWIASAMIGNQADPVPHGVLPRMFMVFAFGVGLVVFATLAGSLGVSIGDLLSQTRSWWIRAWDDDDERRV